MASGFVDEIISASCLDKILSSSEVNPQMKQEIIRLQALKGGLSFYDIYHIAYPEISTPEAHVSMV